MAVTKNLRDSTITFSDGTTPTANSITLVLEEGDLKFDAKQNVINISDRGVLDHQRVGDQEVITGSMTLKYVELIKQSAGTNAMPYEVVTRTGTAASWVTTNTDGGDVFNFTIMITINDPDATRSDEKFTFTKVRVTSIGFQEGADYNTLSFEFQAFQTLPTVAKV